MRRGKLAKRPLGLRIEGTQRASKREREREKALSCSEKEKERKRGDCSVVQVSNRKRLLSSARKKGREKAKLLRSSSFLALYSSSAYRPATPVGNQYILSSTSPVSSFSNFSWQGLKKKTCGRAVDQSIIDWMISDYIHPRCHVLFECLGFLTSILYHSTLLWKRFGLDVGMHFLFDLCSKYFVRYICWKYNYTIHEYSRCINIDLCLNGWISIN